MYAMQDTSMTSFMDSSFRLERSSRRFNNRRKLKKSKTQVESPRMLELHLKKLLKKHHGSTKHKDVLEAIDALTPKNPAAFSDDPTTSPYWSGEFVCHTLPEFPGRIKNDDPTIIQYTLGRLSFGVFQPHNLVCTIRSVRQSIQLIPAESTTDGDTTKTYDYPVMMDLTIHTPDGHDLPAIVSHDALCYKCPKTANRLKVTFKGSTLQPAQSVLQDPKLLETWKATFQGAYAKAEQERGIISKALRGLMGWVFQITFPDDSQMETNPSHSVYFEMKRSPKGHLDVLYLSDNTRITRGNRGTLVVVEPLGSGSAVAKGEPRTHERRIRAFQEKSFA